MFKDESPPCQILMQVDERPPVSSSFTVEWDVVYGSLCVLSQILDRSHFRVASGQVKIQDAQQLLGGSDVLANPRRCSSSSDGSAQA